MRIYLLAALLFVATFSFGQQATPDDDDNDDGRVYTIPVVVHIMKPEKGSILVTPEQVHMAIDYLNRAFSGTYYPPMEPHTADGIAGDIGIQFKLAKQDPEGNPTTGMDWVDVQDAKGIADAMKTEYANNGVKLDDDKHIGCDEVALKGLARWERTHYLNIWVVNKIDGKEGGWWKIILEGMTAGFGTIPEKESFNPDKDGLLVPSYIFKDGFKDYKSTFPHEIGHYLNLYHVFEGDEKLDKNGKIIENDYICPDSAAEKGDKVSDTDPVKQSTEDRTGKDNLCVSGKKFLINTEHNFMSYNPDKYLSLFTNGQKKRMRKCIRTYRKELAITFKETSDSNSEKNNLNRFGNYVVFRKGEKLILQLKSGENLVLTNNRTDDGDGVNYAFIGYSDDLNSFIVENVGYESSDFSFINRNNGAETIVPDINFKLLPSKKWVVFYNNEGDESGFAFSFSENGLEPL